MFDNLHTGSAFCIIVWHTSVFDADAVTTRLVKQVKTKGGLGISWQFGGCLMLFLNSHLRAGQESLKNRVSEYYKILEKMKLPKDNTLGRGGSKEHDNKDDDVCSVKHGIKRKTAFANGNAPVLSNGGAYLGHGEVRSQRPEITFYESEVKKKKNSVEPEKIKVTALPIAIVELKHMHCFCVFIS